MKKVKKNKINKKKTEQVFRPSKEFMEAIFPSIGDHVLAIAVVDKEGKIICVNHGFEALTLWKGERIIGKSLVEIIPREDENRKRVLFKERILSKILSGKVLTSTNITAAGRIEKIPIFYYIRKDKSRFPANSIISPMMLKKKITGAVEVFYDITRERELERMRIDFLSLASHQLRTPLSGTKWLIETMRKGILGKMTKKQEEYLGSIYKTNEQMIKLVSDILDTLRLENEKALIKKEKVSVSSLLKDILSVVTIAAKERKIELQSPLNHRALTLETDSMILKSIIETFLSNAIDYSRPGQKVILDIKDESKATIFSVRDFGIGIPKTEQKRVFDRFYRASNAKILQPNGTGLGLNIARALAEKIGAKISFESDKNKGSTFHLRIPKGRAGTQK